MRKEEFCDEKQLEPEQRAPSKCCCIVIAFVAIVVGAVVILLLTASTRTPVHKFLKIEQPAESPFDLKTEWTKLCSRLNVSAAIRAKWWIKIRDLYSESHRHYHTLKHVRELLEHSTKHNDKLKRSEMVNLAIWFHDVIYDTNGSSKSSEEQSADLLLVFAKEAGLSDVDAKLVYDYIIATTPPHNCDGTDTDLQYLLDFDLAILGASWEKYQKYVLQVRHEYNLFPNAEGCFLTRGIRNLWRSCKWTFGRPRVMKGFLKKEHIFKTAVMRAEREKQAKENIAKEIALIAWL